MIKRFFNIISLLLSYFIVVFFWSTFSYSQGLKIPKKAADIIKQSGASESQIKKMVRDNVKDLNSDFDFPDPDNGIETNNVKNDNLIKELNSVYELDKSNKSSNQNVESNISVKDADKPIMDVVGIPESARRLPGIDNLSSGLIASNYFGYNTFKGSPEIFQRAINESVDPNYIISPGDEIIIMLWGETESNSSYTVSRDGYLFIENVGQVFVNGLNVKRLEEKLFNLLKKVYSSLGKDSKTGSTFFDVSLGSQSLRPLRIFVIGEVNQPGAYEVKPSTTLFTSLYYFDGPKTSGSLRNVNLMRDGKEVGNIDFYDYLVSGKQFNDQQLQRDDVVFIPLRGKTVTVEGEINRPGTYELKDGESLKDLIKYAGGLTATTYLKSAQIERILKPEDRLQKNIDRTLVDISLADSFSKNSKTYQLFDGDIIEFFKVSDKIENMVTISGSVKRPGNYNFIDGLRVVDLIEKSDGLSSDVYYEKADIFRINKINFKKQISINLLKALSGDLNNNIKLQSGDEIIIYQFSNQIFSANVSITGHVQAPGEKEFKKDMSVYDLIFLGGGFNDDSHLADTYFARAELTRYDVLTKKRTLTDFRLDSVLAGRGIADLKLEMGDEIRIFSVNEVTGSPDENITIEGFVKRPGVYAFIDEMKIMDLLFRSGGLEDPFYYESTYLARADLIRFTNNKFNREIYTFDIQKISDNKEENFILKRGDKIRLYSKRLFNLNQTISVNGAVNSPGQFFLKTDMTLIDAILESGGIVPNILNCRIEVARLNPESVSNDSYARVFSVNVVNDSSIFYENNVNNDFFLEPFDFITVRPDPFFEAPRIVSISGKVFYPGDYVITSPNELVTDIIKRAGGLKEDAYPESSALTRDGQNVSLNFETIIKNPKSKYNFVIQDGDVINIGSKLNLVVVEGAVNTPGNYQFIPGYRIKDYIKMSGGFTKEAAKSSVFVVLPSGRTKKMPFFGFSPIVRDGSKIVINTKAEVEPFNFTDYATSLTSIYADLSQAYLLLILAKSN